MSAVLRRHPLRQWVAWGYTAARLVAFVRSARGRLALGLALGVAYSAARLLEPWTIKLILDHVLLGLPLPAPLASALGDGAGRPLPLLNILVAAVVGLAVLRGVLHSYRQRLATRVAREAPSELRLALYGRLQHMSFVAPDRYRTGDLQAHLRKDIRELRDTFIVLPLKVSGDLALVVGMLAVMFVMDWRVTVLAIPAVVGVVLSAGAYRRRVRRAGRPESRREGDGVIDVVRGVRRRSVRPWVASLVWVTVALVIAGALAEGARRVLAGALTPGDLIVLVAYLHGLTRPVWRMTGMAWRAARGVVAGQRVLELLEGEPDAPQAPAAVVAPRFRGAVGFEAVSFRAGPPPSPLVLDDVTLHVEAGERVAIVGPARAGKSALIGLIARLHDPTAGRVTLDGTDVRGFSLGSLRGRLALVHQEPVLFAATIAENIAYGKPGAAPAEVARAARRAGIHEVVAALPAGYDTVLGEGGATLSRGERTCVAIARALLQDAPIVLVDEPAAGLDGRSAALVAEALRRLMEGRTVLMVSHHPASLRDVHRVVVLDGGRVVDEGAPADLRSRAGLYRTLHQLRVGGVAT